jgi:hypothetical protein
MIYLFTTKIDEIFSYHHFFYDFKEKMFMSVIYDCYSFENIKLHVSYINDNNQLIFGDYYQRTLTVKEDELFIIDEKYRKSENRLIMCEKILMTKILESI